MLNNVKHLANVSGQVLARNPSYRQDDTNTMFSIPMLTLHFPLFTRYRLCMSFSFL